MYKFLKLNILTIFICSLLSSCNEDSFTQIVEFDVPKATPKLVINCNYIIGDDSLFVYVDKSRNVGDLVTINPTEFQNAKVELYKNGAKFLDIPYHPQASLLVGLPVFQLNKAASLITDNATYQLKVSAAGYESVESEQITPTKPQLSNGKFENSGFKYVSFGSSEKANLLEFELADTPEENFYTFQVNSVVIDTVSKEKYKIFEPILIDQQFSKDLLNSDFQTKITITDAIFNNKKVNVRLGVQETFFFWDTTSGKVIENAKLIAYDVNVYSMSKEKYLYEESLKEVGDSGGLFGEYVVVNTNIKNGFGIFSIKNKNTINIPIK